MADKCPECGAKAVAIVTGAAVVEVQCMDGCGWRISGLVAYENIRRQLADMTKLAISTGDEGTAFYYKDAYEAEVKARKLAEADNARLREALQDLMDVQNGPPLVRDEEDWNNAMGAARKALSGEGKP